MMSTRSAKRPGKAHAVRAANHWCATARNITLPHLRSVADSLPNSGVPSRFPSRGTVGEQIRALKDTDTGAAFVESTRALLQLLVLHTRLTLCPGRPDTRRVA